jgi:hypothetical protein
LSNSAGSVELASARRTDEIAQEQEYVSMLYGKLDDLRERASDRLARVLEQTGGTPQARVERDANTAMYSEQIAQYGAGAPGRPFGRGGFYVGTNT